MIRPQLITAAALIFVATFAQQAASGNNQPAVLEGTVVHGVTKEPLRKARVTLDRSDAAQHSALVATTDETGRFRFADVAPGQYHVTAKKNSFLDGGYGKDTVDRDTSLLRISSGEHVQNLTLLLFPAGSISGQVLDADGDPSPDAGVTLWSRSMTRRHLGKLRAINQTTADRDGQYRFDGLSPETYYVSAQSGEWQDAVHEIPVDNAGKPTKLRDLATFYPDAVSGADAQGVRIESGQERAAIDIRLQRGPLLSIKGRIAGAGAQVSRYNVTATVEEDRGFTGRQATVSPNGEFLFTELPSGTHTLTLLENGPNGSHIVGQQEVTLASEDRTGIVLSRFKPAQVRVRVIMQGEEDKPLTDGAVALIAPDSSLDAAPGFSQYQPQNGTYVIDDVRPGKYQVFFTSAAGCYLKSVESGSALLNPKSIDVGEGAVLDLLMTYSRNVASLSGDVEVSQDQPKPSVHVLVIAEDGEDIPELSDRRPELDQYFHFSISHMRPGKYVAFAAEDDDPDLWDSPEFMHVLQSQGTEIELHEKESASVHLKLIPKSETDRVRKQLGR
jgi:protocatechuate 3,4-dioxygenase beta subunit